MIYKELPADGIPVTQASDIRSSEIGRAHV